MNVSLKMDRKSKRRFEKALSDFADHTGKSVEHGIKQIAKATGKRLAHTVQPYGTKINDKGEAFEKSIGAQVQRALINSNVTGGSRNAAREHQQRRDRRGRVPKSLVTEGSSKWSPISLGEMQDLEKKKRKNAGLAKGGWIEAADSIGVGKLTNIGQWIARHRSRGYGSSSIKGKGIKTKVWLTNEVPYIHKAQKDRARAQAIATGQIHGYKEIKKIVEALIKKASR